VGPKVLAGGRVERWGSSSPARPAQDHYGASRMLPAGAQLGSVLVALAELVEAGVPDDAWIQWAGDRVQASWSRDRG
jgi:hypothetical protein